MKKLKLLLIIPMIIGCHSDIDRNYQLLDDPTPQSDTITNIEPSGNNEVEIDYTAPDPENNSMPKPLVEKSIRLEDNAILINDQLTTLVSTTTKIKDPESVPNTQSDNKPSNQNSDPVIEQPSSTNEETQIGNASEEPIPPFTELEPLPLCPNALYDENKPCDYIHPNMLARDELGRDVPSFDTPNKAWDWAENEMYDEASTWYMCGFTLMEGYYNDETIFYYAYMKACP